MFWIFIALLSQQATSSANLPTWQVTGSREQGFTFETSAFAARQASAVDAMLMTEATKRCAPLVPRLGSYSVDNGTITANGSPVPAFIKYRRLIGCTAVNTQADTSPTPFVPAAQDEFDAHTAFDAYFAALDGGDIDAAMKLSDPGPWTREQLQKSSEAFLATAGKGQRIVYQISWRLDPPDQPHHGVYVDVGYYGRFSHEKIVCGYALFYRQDEGVYLFSRDLMRLRDSAGLPQAGNPCPSNMP